ncbi:dehydrogenase/reductase SDR family member on chromosome X-like [Lytechinus variegatus]|uniref:dehydrogenase/reductase SDR family member on chromosome X-like n=1 Tax=Lytechinus variegatus TaxID=7654 RepID=UPI001BB26416|nr:dehydrogenase/reductase SDR family member on chromosome X-like [Lytechinus variegatus]
MGTTLASQRAVPDVDLSQKTAIVTGANTGIGYDTAKTFAQLGAKVIVACRSESKAKEAIERMHKEHKEEKGNEKKTKFKIKANELDIEFMALDLSSLESTMDFVKAFKAKKIPLHILVCNAGMAYGGEVKTADGFEIHFQVNYLSHFLMTLHLLPELKSAGPNAKIVLVSSMAYRGARWQEDNMQAVNRDQLSKYGFTKLYQIMEMFTLADKLKGSGIDVFSLHPGFVDTDITKKDGQQIAWLMRVLVSVITYMGLARTTFDGALTSIHAAINPEFDGKTAIYLENSKPATLQNPLATDKEKQAFLWKYSLDCLKDYVTEDTLKDLTSQ